MTNAQILSESLNQWASPIIAGYIDHVAQQSQIGYFVSSLISPQRLMGSLQQYVAAPLLHTYISKMPDPVIPDLSLDLLDGMIEQRVKDGAITVPFLGASLGADAFRDLKNICQANYTEYGEQPTPVEPAEPTTV